MSSSLERADEKVSPIHAQGFFYVGRNISYYIVFDYVDPEGYYKRVLSNSELYHQEIARLYSGMKDSLREEEITINGIHVEPSIRLIDIGFRGVPNRVFIVYGISLDVELKSGINKYVNKYIAETIEYNYEVYWIFPPNSKIVSVDMGSYKWEILKTNVLAIYGKRGEKTPGYEEIVFELP